MDGRLFYLLSRLSFGMYLNHPYMVGWMNRQVNAAFVAGHLGPLLVSPVSFVCVTACSVTVAMATFCLIEHPFLILRTALLARKEVAPLIAQ